MDKKEEIYDVGLSENILSEEEAKDLAQIQREFLESYASSKDKMPVEEWLPKELQKQMPEKSSEEIKEMSAEIIGSLKTAEEMKASQQKALAAGMSKDSWFASTILQFASHMSAQESAKYLQSLDEAVKNANAAMHETITTKQSGYIIPSMNPNLDGYVAEQYHVNSFNMNAAAKGSGLRAEVQPLKPGETYTKNGFDVVIKDASGKRIHQYQMKYGIDDKHTINMIKSGNYNNQTIVVPEEQVDAVKKAFPNKTITSTISEGDVSSNPLTKKQAKEMQEKAQAANFMDVDWNDYVAKDIAIGIGKQTGYASLQGAVIGAGMKIAKDIWNGEPIDGKEVIETAIVSGADFGIKTATAGALKAATEKGVFKSILKGAGSTTYANIAFVAIENVKISFKVATGELTDKEGLELIEQTTSSCVAGIATSAKGAEIGMAIGSFLGPIGVTVGSVVGGTIGYMVGSKFAQTIVKGVQKVRNKAVQALKSIGSAVVSGFKSVKRRIADWLGF